MKQLRLAIIDSANPPKALVDIHKNATDPTKFEWGETVADCKVYPCHKAQLDILRSKVKFTFAFAGSGAGKTCIIPLWLFKQVQTNPKGRFLVVSPTVATFNSSQLKDHILRTFADTLYQGTWAKQQGTYTLPTGGEVIVKTVGDGGEYERLIGGQYDAAVADECYELSEEVWEEIRRRVSNKNGPILAVTTPTGNNWIWDCKQRADKGDKDYFARTWSKTDNPTVSMEDVLREQTLMSAARYRRMVLGEFAAYEGLIYDCFSDPHSPTFPVVNADPMEGLPSKPIRFFGGNDWGYKPDPACFLMIAECEDGCMYAVEEIYGTEITPGDYARQVRMLIDKWSLRVDSQYADMIDGGRFLTAYTDTSRPELSAAFRNAGIPIRNKKVADILAGIANTDKWFRANRLKIYANCKNLIRELKGYSWQKDRSGAVKDKPKEKDNHAVDSIRYAISSHKYGVDPMPFIAAPIDEVKELAKLERLGIAPNQNEGQLKELERKRQNERFYYMAFGDLIDD